LAGRQELPLGIAHAVDPMLGIGDGGETGRFTGAIVIRKNHQNKNGNSTCFSYRQNGYFTATIPPEAPVLYRNMLIINILKQKYVFFAFFVNL
jgi:hypothetical protein